MPGDSRKEFVLATAANFFGLPGSDPAITNCSDSSALNGFLDDGGTAVLAGRMEGKKLALLNKVCNIQ
jgi:dynein heavy chain 2